ncbi:MAG: hypothetical protein AAGI66_09675 [Cyanobacteria bacterium P01_H01_bin.74]
MNNHPQQQLHPNNCQDLPNHHSEAPMDAQTNALTDKLTAVYSSYTDPYDGMNAMRHWVNDHFDGFELYLEDEWNVRTEGETHLEYILRSRKTLNETAVIAYDAYYNHRDAKGVWHLGNYIQTVVLMHDRSILAHFLLTENND